MNAFYNDVNEWLSVGGDLDLAKDLTQQDYQTTIAQLREHGVTYVLDLRSEWNDADTWQAEGLPAANHCYAPITDSWNHSPAESWYEAVESFVLKFWMESVEGDRLLTQCHMGINRAPSAAMLALLTVDPLLDPFDAFLTIRAARPVAGLVYAESVGVRHLLNAAGLSDFTEDDDLPAEVVEFSRSIGEHWTPDRRQAVNRGIGQYRSAEGGTLLVRA